MTLLMIGPKEEVGKLESFAKTLDKELCAVMGKSYEADLAGLEKVWEVVDLNYAEPSLIELDLKSRFKGLQVSLMPNPVTPGAKGSTSASQSQSGSTGAGAAAAGSTSTETTTDTKDISGHEPMRIVLRGTRAQIDEAKDYLAMVDLAPRQIALELRVMELSQEEAEKIGIDWNLITGGRLNPFRVNQSAGDTAATPGTISGGIQFNANDSATVLATLDKLNGGRNLIARPNALVSDGRATNLFVGDTVRYVKSIQSTQNGTTVETDEVKVGVSFDISARVGGNGKIALDLSQNFNILTGFTPVPGGGNLPQTSDRLTNMFVNMQSGETLAIGGLILEQDRKTVNGVPLLKDLPIIGALFRRSSTSKSKTEIVFFLTAHEVNESNRRNAASPRQSEKKTPDPLGDYQRVRAPKGGKDGKALR
jgi:type II secretory pathway component GspD/PulD (secretin)